MAIDMFATVDALQGNLRNHVAIVVDVLRATTVMTTGLNNGAKSIIPVESIDEAVEMARKLGNERVLLCGERNCLKIPEFHLSNSPLEYESDIVEGKVLVLTTTNGTKTIKQLSECQKVFVGCFLNATAVAKAAITSCSHVARVCAGTQGRFSLDDVICAGAIISKIIQVAPEQYMCDFSRTALTLYESYRDDLYNALKGCTHVDRLRSLGLEQDVIVSIQEDTTLVVPIYDNSIITAM